MASDDANPQTPGGTSAAQAEEDEQIVVRRAKLAGLRAKGEAFPNDFRPTAVCADLVARFGALDGSELEREGGPFRLAGRIVAIRSFGKSAFLTIQDGSARLQLYAQLQSLGEEAYGTVRTLDIGDIIGVEGALFRTRTGELTLRCTSLRLLVKALRPLPEKWHGLTDVETRYRRRYVDLITNDEVREVFRRRTQVVQGIRDFLVARGFLEVETPMMQPIAGGAAARPFVTHHNALSLDMYLRVAPELYLKRLVVGGLGRVFELNRNFRNEGVSPQHNPEFTMCEFYQAYATYEDLMGLTEELVERLAREVRGARTFAYQGTTLDFSAPFARVTIPEAVASKTGLSPDAVLDPSTLAGVASRLEIPVVGAPSLAILVDIFDRLVEEELVQPTFVTGFPVGVSPLARRSAHDARFVDRFELYIAGREIANGFSELNDPEDQHERFLAQVEAREAGDEEAQMMDEDYIRALEYGLPPTAGEGIGVDRLVMMLTDSASIRDVILFPHLRPERR